MKKAVIRLSKKAKAAFFSCALLLLALSVSADYQMQISVDSQGVSAQQAKEQGITLGKKRAFDTLLSRLLPNSELEKTKQIAVDPEKFLVTYHLAQERVSSTRYRADISYQFDSKRLYSFFHMNQLSYLDAMIPRFIVLPLIRHENQLKFYWPALDILREIEVRYPLLDFLLPLGDLNDDHLFDDQAQTAQSLFGNLNNRYGLSSTLIIIFDVSKTLGRHSHPHNEEGDFKDQKNTAEQEELILNRIVIKPFGLMDFESLVYQLRAPDPLTIDVIKQHLGKIFPMLIGNWFDNHLVKVTAPGNFLYEIKIDGLKSMTVQTDVLEKMPRMDQIQLKEFDEKNMVVALIYRGDRQDLERELAAKNILFKALNQSLPAFEGNEI